MGKKIAVISQKGGVGKTTTVVNLGYCLADEGKKVLLIDMDPSRSLTCMLGLEKETFGIAELLENTINKVPLPPKSDYVKEVNGIDCMPCTNKLTLIAQAIITVPKNEMLFKRTIAGIASGYDYILVDCGSRLDLISVMIVAAVDGVILLTMPDMPAVYGIPAMVTSILKTKKSVNPDLEIDGVLITMFEKRTNLTKKVVEYIEEEFGKFLPVFKTRIPRSITVNEALGEGQSIVRYQKGNMAAIAYREFAKEVLEIDRDKHVG